MSRYLHLSAFVIVFTLLFAAVAAVIAEDPQVPNAQPAEPIPSGTYQPFTMIQKIRLGATALVNPSAAENAAIVYSFEPEHVLGDDWSREISGKIAAGQVQFGQTIRSGVYTIIKVDDKTNKDLANVLANQSSAAKLQYTRRGKFLSTEATLGGVRSSGEWIAWWPEEQKK